MKTGWIDMSIHQCLLVGFLFLFLLFVFSGCTSEDLLTTISSQDSDASSHLKLDCFLEKVGSFGSFEVWRDKVTDVLYLMRSTNSFSASGIGFTVMYHPDGSPLLYSELIEMIEED